MNDSSRVCCSHTICDYRAEGAMNVRVAALVGLGFTSSHLAGPLQERDRDRAQGRALTFHDRFAAQRAIQQVYWSHRISPEANPGPKPPRSAVLPDSAIRSK